MKSNRILDFCERYNFKYIELDKEEYNDVVDFMENYKYKSYRIYSSNTLLYFGRICSIKMDFDDMKYYYKKAISLENSYAMNSMGCHYLALKKYKKMKKYFKMALSFKNDLAIINFANYYNTIKKYSKMKKYCLWSLEIDEQNEKALNLLEKYYQETEFDNDLDSYLWYLILSNTKFEVNANISILTVSSKTYDLLNEIDDYNLPTILIHLKNNHNLYLNLMTNMFDYAPNGEGYNNAKKNYETLLP